VVFVAAVPVVAVVHVATAANGCSPPIVAAATEPRAY
jgi:hypothetical protein